MPDQHNRFRQAYSENGFRPRIKKFFLLVGTIAFSMQVASASEQPLTPETQQYVDEVNAIWSSLEGQQDDVGLPNGVASLEVPENFFYLDPGDAEKVLVEVWGNPPGTGTNTLGMLLPADATPFGESTWAVTIEYIEDGYVSDHDADRVDYDALLALMQADTAAVSEERVGQGYESIELIGWASRPYYDRETHKLHWAKELKFGNQPVNTLNYDIRILGRQGILVISFIASMSQHSLIVANIDTVLGLARFDQGYRYEDFVPGADQVAAYGIGTLVAGKALARTGFLASAMAFLKQYGVFILIGLGLLVSGLIKRKALI